MAGCCRRWYQKFETLENQPLRQRADDVLDLGRNVIRRLRGERDGGLKAIPEDSILVVQRLLPSERRIAAQVARGGGGRRNAGPRIARGASAREKGIPTIAEIPGILALVGSGAELLVDGFRGTLVIAPTTATRSDFQERMEKWRATLVRCKGACREPARTLDGQLVGVEANIGIHDDAESRWTTAPTASGCCGSSNSTFCGPRRRQRTTCAERLEGLIAPLGNRSVTVRLLDIGGDKPLPYLPLPPSSNPGLGRRGVRLLLDYSQLVRTQLGAILKLSREHSLRVLVPMVTLEDDIRRMREAFDAMSAERKVASPPAFGAMVETPAAALALPALLKYVDFFCVGTNDLTQYTLAAARDNAAVNDYYLDGHESVMRLLGIVATEAADRPVTLCGELAGREAFVPRLLKMGFRTLSVAPNVIPPTKALIRTLDISDSTG